jgi:hypothetical protein
MPLQCDDLFLIAPPEKAEHFSLHKIETFQFTSNCTVQNLARQVRLREGERQ